MLSSYRVLDLTDERGHLAGMILASLGAEVIAVEPPGGSPARRLSPFHHDVVDPERSLVHWAFNRGKRSVVLDLDSAEGQSQLRQLAAGADVLIESFAPGHLAARGLGPDDLAALNPALVQVSITAFGSDGPKAGWAESDLIVAAASGHMALTGDPDLAPLRVSAPPQAFHQAAGEAAGAALVALTERRRSGRGQHVDVSAQVALMASTQAYMLAHPLGAASAQRAGGGARTGTTHVKLVWECADGHVSLTLLFGASLGPFARRLFDWMLEEGACTQADRDTDWVNLGMQIHNGEVPMEEWERLKDVVARFLLTKTKAELLEVALDRKLLFAPLATPGELAERDQLEVRGYWHDVEHPDLGETVRYPGHFTKFSRTPVPPLGRPPKLGEHTAEVLAEPPRSPAVVRNWSRAASGSWPLTDPDDPRPLAGLKVVDFMWAVAGPTTTRCLADFGATVIRIETEGSVDGARTVGPFVHDDPGPDVTGIFQNMNAGKLGLSLDLGNPASRDVVLDLVRWADVVTESFSPLAMPRWKLSYEHLAEVNPGLVMVSSCLMGQYGPLATYAGFGTMAAAICGFHHLTGWPDRAPVGPFSAYTDYVAPRFTLAALLAALDHRDRTGEGQYLDFSQAEASLHLLAPQLLDYRVNGRVAERAGNDDPDLAPHGVYACAGDDRWVAVACRTDAEWRALCRELGRTDWLDDPGLACAPGRLARRRELDAGITAWTSARADAAVQDQLQQAGIPAHQVQNSPECFADPQLAHLGHFCPVPHTLQGTTWVEGPRFRLARTPGAPRRGAPMLGEHSWEILADILGYDADRIAELAAAEVLG